MFAPPQNQRAYPGIGPSQGMMQGGGFDQRSKQDQRMQKQQGMGGIMGGGFGRRFQQPMNMPKQMPPWMQQPGQMGGTPPWRQMGQQWDQMRGKIQQNPWMKRFPDLVNRIPKWNQPGPQEPGLLPQVQGPQGQSPSEMWQEKQNRFQDFFRQMQDPNRMIMF